MKEGVWEWWATYTLELDTELEAEAIVINSSSTSGSDENVPRQPTAGQQQQPAAAAGKGGVRGLRHRLVPLRESLQRALPGEGKVTLLYEGRSCEAALELPTSDTK